MADPYPIRPITADEYAAFRVVLPIAGVTAVSVLPTYRRRGILRSLMHRQIADIAARGEEYVAALWASETPLYGRYGYGRASSLAFFRFGRGEGALGAAGLVSENRPGTIRRLSAAMTRDPAPWCPQIF